MAWLLLAVLIQAPVQDKPIEERIDAYLKGDGNARAELLKLGAKAILPVLKARDKGPEKIDDLRFELKKAATDARGRTTADLMTKPPMTVELKEATVEAVLTELKSFEDFSNVYFFLDRFLERELKSSRVTIKSTSTREALDQLCLQTGLDYGFFHNAIVIGKPERLWPSPPPSRAPELRGEPLERAKAWVERLNDESIEEREKATRELLSLGTAVLPLLEANLKRGEVELVARCRALIDRFRQSLPGVFGSSGVERQMKDAQVEKHLSQLRVPVVFALTAVPMDRVAPFLERVTGLPVDLRGDAPRLFTTIRAKSHSLVDLFALITQSWGMDFMILNGWIVIDTRENIETLISTPK